MEGEATVNPPAQSPCNTVYRKRLSTGVKHSWRQPADTREERLGSKSFTALHLVLILQRYSPMCTSYSKQATEAGKVGVQSVRHKNANISTRSGWVLTLSGSIERAQKGVPNRYQDRKNRSRFRRDREQMIWGLRRDGGRGSPQRRNELGRVGAQIRAIDE